ncbi:MAG: (2Fe-2S)-binding protein [Gemmatimonadetes bacterium]|nr:(2Fe-2S)-binding protein [Gemmatimonadota bacterium]
MNVTIHVNGTRHTIDVPPEMPLLWVLRDILDLKGTKFGCGIAQCGACTVHVNGNPTRSCITRASVVDGAEIRTIEGLSPDGTHALQRAWMELDVPQCGYCQAGQLMSAAALLEDNPAPTDEDIDRAMNGNLCRCTTYLRIRRAIHHAAAIRGRQSPVDGAGGPDAIEGREHIGGGADDTGGRGHIYGGAGDTGGRERIDSPAAR